MPSFALAIETPPTAGRKDSNVGFGSSWSNSFSAHQNWLRDLAATEADKRSECAVDDHHPAYPLESTFCRNFTCCSKTLTDLHDLLSHYEECHVSLDDDTSSVNAYSHPALAAAAAAAAAVNQGDRPDARPDISAIKRRERARMMAAMEIDDEPSTPATTTTTTTTTRRSPSTSSPSAPTKDVFAFSRPSSPETSGPPTPGGFVAPTLPVDPTVMVQGAPQSAEDWIFAQDSASSSDVTPVAGTPVASHEHTNTTAFREKSFAGPLTIDSPGSNLVVVDKPFKCPAPGCDKAYKNQNGLKYHRLHGHCTGYTGNANGAGADRNSTSGNNNDDDEDMEDATSDSAMYSPASYNPVIENKPYRCELCSKRYKNLNGLKYHRAHSHLQVSMDQAQREVELQSWAFQNNTSEFAF